MSKEILIPVDKFRLTMFSRRGFPVSHSYIYRLIREYEKGQRLSLPFKYKQVGKGIMIVKD